MTSLTHICNTLCDLWRYGIAFCEYLHYQKNQLLNVTMEQLNVLNIDVSME